MSEDDEAPEEAGSDACPETSKCKMECKQCSQSCLADSSEAGSSSDQDPSDSLSGSEECLARIVCLKKTRLKCASSSGSSEDKSSTCSVSSASESAKCHSKSKDHVPEPTSGSEDTESSTTKSSTAAAQSEDSSQSNKTSNCEKNSPEATNIKDKSGWSLSEDSLLRSMKEANDGLSWEEIGKSLNRGKTECKSRWKVIRNQPKQDALPEDGSNGNAEHEAPSPTEADDGTAAEADGKTAGDADPINTPPPDQRVDEAADKVSRPHGEDDLSEHERQKQYWHRHIGRHLYPASIRIEPDAHFSQGDCRVLEMIDARYGSMRWLEAQARFYNETGRMVPLEVIRRKCEDATVRRTEADIDGWLESISD
ncbi:hypothetical protein BB8028_0003g03580 [Beauveria bassiana]|uniref:Myb-like domain-containing protein n=1 Tax=Beauveria bassiana TaxID=176275 RepID=A0A2S7Y6S1_BEABA|nr:hypothetical protein BB8028_0003g03580 [Beauveria bassiana]